MSAQAGDVFVNGSNMGKLDKITMDYKSDKTGTIIITTKQVTVAPPPPPVDGLQKCYKSKLDLYTFIVAAPYRGTVFADGVKIRSGVAAPVYFKTQQDGMLCR